ncbi:MAG: peptidase M19 [Gammaproteobacteria bacterium]|nr:peptidase M19 [Gammaproteobacteria bacterium]
MQKLAITALMALMALVLSACGSSPNNEVRSGLITTNTLPTDQYSMANGCYGLFAVSNGKFVVNNNDNYVASTSSPDEAEAFFMKPAMLGQQIFYATDLKVITASGGNVIADAAISEDAIWHVDFNAISRTYSFTADSSGENLIVGANDQLTLGQPENNNHLFTFALTNKGCTPYPEMPLSLTGETYKGQGVDKPAIGFADVHSHITMGEELSFDGSRTNPIGGPFHGTAVSRLGVTHALADCAENHGINGERDGNNVVQGDPTGTHQTDGWPTFTEWPAGEQLTHQSAYYRWIERSYLAGLRLLVNYGTNINALCEVAAMAYNANADPTAACNDHKFSMDQVAFTHDIESYIDAQHGGPGKGWFRIVYSPQEAREVINDGKLAVVLGLEGSQLFDCGVTISSTGETPHCTQESFEQKLDEAYEAGVRQIVPLHNIDNAFAGGSVLDGGADTLNMLNYYDTGSFYQTVDCPDGGEDGYFWPGGSYMAGVPTNGDDPVSEAFFDALQGPLPAYDSSTRQCNARPLNALGEHAYSKFFEKGLIISIDHAPLLVKRTLLDLAAQEDPPYPIISGHGYQGGVRNDDVKDLLKAGGYTYPYKWDGASFVDTLNRAKVEYDRAAAEDPTHMLPFASGFGFDINGFGGYNPPRPNPEQLVHYPFTLFEGAGWGSQFDHIAPMTIDKISIPDGRTWDTEIDGSAHFGMLPDFVEEIRLEGGEDAITAFYNSAEVYIQLWEKVYKGD